MPVLDEFGNGVAVNRMFQQLLEMEVVVGEGLFYGFAAAQDAARLVGAQQATILVALPVEHGAGLLD